MGEEMKAKPLSEDDYGVLAAVTDKPEQSREVAARLFGVTVEEVLKRNLNERVWRSLVRLRSHGLVERGYEGTTGTNCTYALSEAGRERIQPFTKFLSQAA
jgi:DNA-binding PadR family transcriptional regulator